MITFLPTNTLTLSEYGTIPTEQLLNDRIQQTSEKAAVSLEMREKNVKTQKETKDFKTGTCALEERSRGKRKVSAN